MTPLQVKCCIAGGGPAGMMLGFLLARAGVEVVVLEKHKDFLRDFRGDTVHPSTLNIMHELGLLEDFLKRPHQSVTEIHGRVGDADLRIADFTKLPGPAKQMVLMPQWDFLDFLKEKAAAYPQFHLRMQTNVTDLIKQGGKVTGVTAQTPDGSLQIKADLVIGADGRHSTVRDKTTFSIKDLGAPIDVLWMRISKQPGDLNETLGIVNYGRILVMLDRGDYWQCALVVKKGETEAMRERGLDALKDDLARLSKFPRARFDELKSRDDIKVLNVTVNHLRRWWKPGLLCIGDAAHAMSPVGGVGINLAIQDAVATANILAGPLLKGHLTNADLHKVQQRRSWPAYGIQRMQTFVHTHVMGAVMAENKVLSPPWPVRLLDKSRFLRGIPARIIGLGLRPEHVDNRKTVS